MRVAQFYPILLSRDVGAASAFYQAHFGFRAAFSADWYVHLQSVSDPRVNMAVLDAGHETIPAIGRGLMGTSFLVFEVEDAGAEFARLTEAGLSILQPLTDEAFGQRHFILAAPDGVMIDVVTPIPPSAEFAAGYAADALPA